MDAAPPPRAQAGALAWTLLAGCALAAHAALATAWWWALPRGFAAGHPQWWANEVAPWLVIATTLAGLTLLARRRRVGARTALLALAAGWIGIALGAVAVFPASGPAFAIMPALAGAFVGLLARADRTPSTGRRSIVAWSVTAAALGAGAFLASTQRGADPDTRPLGGLVPPPRGATAGAPRDLVAGRVRVDVPGLRLTIEPLLTFVSCSPDRCWTLFAPGGPVRRPYALTGFTTTDPGEEAWYARDDAFDATRAHLAVRRHADGGLELDAETLVTREVYAHLDSYTHLDAAAPDGASLSLVFSPCPDTPIEVRAADYPVGRPARFAYVDDQGAFRVVEATSGEKGPFVELARGVVDDGSLAITLLVGGAPACRITWRDFLAQAGRAPSPTAGWGLPVNAIAFRLGAPGHLSLWCTLASTSVGRGYQSVGHAPGVYTNRLRVERLR